MNIVRVASTKVRVDTGNVQAPPPLTFHNSFYAPTFSISLPFASPLLIERYDP